MINYYTSTTSSLLYIEWKVFTWYMVRTGYLLILFKAFANFLILRVDKQ